MSTYRYLKQELVQSGIMARSQLSPLDPSPNNVNSIPLALYQIQSHYAHKAHKQHNSSNLNSLDKKNKCYNKQGFVVHCLENKSVLHKTLMFALLQQLKLLLASIRFSPSQTPSTPTPSLLRRASNGSNAHSPSARWCNHAQ
jgi:hypothetical protein